MAKSRKPIMVSLDTSSESSGYAVYEAGILGEHGHLDHFKKTEGEFHVQNMNKDLISLLNRIKPAIVVIEKPPYAKGNPNTHVILCIIIGVVRGWCLEHDCEFDLVHTSVWRAALNPFYPVPKKREDLKKWSTQIAGVIDDNEADAILIGRAWLLIWDKVELGDIL